jgi:hypothetical protein
MKNAETRRAFGPSAFCILPSTFALKVSARRPRESRASRDK